MDEDEDILTYTPLKRRKIKDEKTTRASQVPKKYVKGNDKLIKNLSLSQNSKLKKSRNSSPSKPNHRMHNFRSISSTLPIKEKKELQFKTPLSLNQHNKNSKSINMINLNKVNERHSKKNLTSKIPYLNKEETATETLYMQVEDLLEEDTPDIDIDLANKNSSKLDSNQVQNSSLSEYSDVSDISISLLDNMPNTPIQTESEHLDAKAIKEMNNKFNHCKSLQLKGNSNEKPNEKLDNKISVVSVESDDIGYCAPSVTTDMNKVNSWVNSTLQYVEPRKIEIKEETRDHDRSQCNSTQDDLPKACIHFHLHVNSPKKIIQPTIDCFFKPVKTNLKTENEEGEAASSSKPVSGGCNKQEVLKTWQNIMSNMIGNSSSEGTSKNYKNNFAASSSTEVGTSSMAKSCPFYKYVEGTNFVVDAFSYGHVDGVSAYFLSHFHYDHYRGLNKNFKRTIYCSRITANLVHSKIKIADRYLRQLPLEEPRVIDGVEVTLYDANHCPGAVMFLFRLVSGKVILHVGDFRANPDMENICGLSNNSLDVLYLDTTYLDPRYSFLSQEEVLEKCVDIATEHMSNPKKTLFLVGSYTIGKEKVFKAIAAALNSKIYVEPYKERTLRCIEDLEITKRLTKFKSEAKVHVVPMNLLTPPKLKTYIDSLQPTFNVLVALKPTGWEHNGNVCEDLNSLRPTQIGNIYIYGIPYSEHSSFKELERFVKFFQPTKIIPTVNNGNAVSRKKMESYLERWKTEARIQYRTQSV